MRLFHGRARLFQSCPLDPDELGNAVRSAGSGGTPMTSAITRKLIDYFHRPAPESPPGETITLAPRQCEVLEQLSHGLAYKEIAALMGCSYSTINQLELAIPRAALDLTTETFTIDFFFPAFLAGSIIVADDSALQNGRSAACLDSCFCYPCVLSR